MDIGIITGASSGLGAEYARQIGQKMQLDELWLIARRRDRLDQLAGELDVPCRVLPLDLTQPQSIQELQSLLEEQNPQVMALVCAAGFAKFAFTQDLSVDDHHRMVAVNCTAAVEVTRACIPYLVRGSRVLEIASSASFQPLPGLNLYAATKAFLRSYTRALRWELRGRGIRATAVCPWWIKTEFEQVARQTQDGGATVNHVVHAAQKPHSVVSWSLKMNSAHMAVATCNPIAFFMRIAGKILPSCVIMAIWEGLRRV